MSQPTSNSGAVARRGGLLGRVALFVVLAVALILIGLRVRYGGGASYPDVTGAPLLPDSALEVVVTSPEPIGNLAVSATGRVFYTLHPESRPEGARLFEWVEGKPVPFPDEQSQGELFETPLGLAIDGQERLWVIDHGNHAMGKARLQAFDVATGKRVHEHVFERHIAERLSFLQDLRVDARGETVYIADVSFWRQNPGLVVYDVAKGQARRVLDSHASVLPQDWIIHNPIKPMVFFGGLVALKAGVDGLALSRDGEWLYYGAMNHDTLYRVRTADLREASLPPAELSRRVEAVGRKPLNDGLSTDSAGNVLVTDVEHGAVLRMSPEGKLETLVKTPRIRWADALSYGPDGWLYLADSSIPHQMLQSKQHIRQNAPYYIFRFKPGIAGVAGQ